MGAPGASAPSSYSINYDALLTTTLERYRAEMVDNIFKSSAFLMALRTMGGIEYVNGGERISQPLMYEENSTVQSYRGYDTLDTSDQDGMTTAFYEWAEIAGTITISRREKRQNSGEAAILKLLEKKVLQAEMTIKNKVNTQLVQGTAPSSGALMIPGNEGKDLYPLGYFLPLDFSTDPSGTGVVNVGNIARATYSWWRHRTADLSTASPGTTSTFGLAVTTYKGLIRGFRDMYLYCTRGADGSSPNLILCDQDTFSTYESAVDERSRLASTALGEVGFDSLKMRGATVIWDEVVPDVNEGKAMDDATTARGSAFFLNTKFYKLVIDEESDFETTPFIEPENQTASTAKILFMGQACSSNQRKLGVCYEISKSIVA